MDEELIPARGIMNGTALAMVAWLAMVGALLVYLSRGTGHG